MNVHLTETNPPGSPADFKRRILLCVAGLSPQVITETLYALAARTDKFIPTCIHVITTSEGARRIRLNLLEPDPNEQHFHRLCAELNIDPTDIIFNSDTIHQISAPADNRLPMPTYARRAGEEDHDSALEDIRSEDDNDIAADAITGIVRALTADPEAAVHASIAGGRKTMGFYLGYALSLFGREQDRLSHVLVSPPFESRPQFYYPPKTPMVLLDRNNGPIHTREASITLADIPFVRLRGHLDGGILGESMSYSETVARTQRNVNPPELVLDATNRTLHCAGQAVALTPSLFAFYAWFVRRLLAGKPGIHWSQDGAAGEYLAEYGRIVSECGGDYEEAERGLKNGMTPEDFEPKVSKIKKKLQHKLGIEPARPYLFSDIGTIPGSHRRLKGLTLKPEQVRFSKS